MARLLLALVTACAIGAPPQADLGVASSTGLVVSAGIGARVQGMRRYYALLLSDGGKARLIKALDGEAVLAEADFPWQFDVTYELGLEVRSNRLLASIDGEDIFEVEDEDRPLVGGAVAFVCEEGRMESDVIRVQPVDRG